MLREEVQAGGSRTKPSQNHVLFGPHRVLTIEKVTYRSQFLTSFDKGEGLPTLALRSLRSASGGIGQALAFS